MTPNSPSCSFIHASMAGSRSTAPLNRSNSVLTIALLSAFEIYGNVELFTQPRTRLYTSSNGHHPKRGRLDNTNPQLRPFMQTFQLPDRTNLTRGTPEVQS